MNIDCVTKFREALPLTALNFSTANEEESVGGSFSNLLAGEHEQGIGGRFATAGHSMLRNSGDK